MVEQFRAQRRRETRDSTLVAGVVGLVALPIWAAFDLLMVPGQAREFLIVRAVCLVAMALTWLALWWRRTGERWPEQLSVLLVGVLEVSIAWMIPRVGDALEAYLLGLSLAVYATAFLMAWRWPMTVALSGCTVGAIVIFSVGASPGLEPGQVTTTGFYLVTAFALAIAAQVYRERKEWQQHLTASALEEERRRNATLVEELEQLSREDPLTSAGNRRAWDERSAGELLRARRSGRPLSVLICDLDHFKAVNDLHGHTAGDTVLRMTTAALADRLREGDLLARLGGDEFAILCRDTSLAAAAELAGELRDGIRSTEFPSGIAMTCSIGAAELERADPSIEALFARADEALYEAKTVRDTVRCAEPRREPEGRRRRRSIRPRASIPAAPS